MNLRRLMYLALWLFIVNVLFRWIAIIQKPTTTTHTNLTAWVAWTFLAWIASACCIVAYNSYNKAAPLSASTLGLAIFAGFVICVYNSHLPELHSWIQVLLNCGTVISVAIWHLANIKSSLTAAHAVA